MALGKGLIPCAFCFDFVLFSIFLMIFSPNRVKVRVRKGLSLGSG